MEKLDNELTLYGLQFGGPILRARQVLSDKVDNHRRHRLVVCARVCCVVLYTP